MSSRSGVGQMARRTDGVALTIPWVLVLLVTNISFVEARTNQQSIVLVGITVAATLLGIKFTLYAPRNRNGRPRLADHQRQWREVIASVVRADSERLGADPLMPVDEAVAMILVMDNGYLLSETIEPGNRSTSEHLFAHEVFSSS